MDFPMGLGDDGKKDDDNDKKSEGKRERAPDKKDKEKEPQLKKQASLTLSVSLNSPDPAPTGVDTFSGTVDEGATFAVWNLWDLGGGPHSSHWKEETLVKLPGELKAINASVLGLLEIKTGHAIAVQLPKDKPTTTAFEIGALTGWIIKWYFGNLYPKIISQPPKQLSQIIDEVSKMMWVSDDSRYLEAGLKASLDYDPTFYVSDLEAALKDMILAAADYLNELNGAQLQELYLWMTKRCSRYRNSWYQDPTIDLVDLEGQKEKTEFWSKKKIQLLGTWKYVPKAFENFGVMVSDGEAKTQGKEAQGIKLITPVLEKFIEENDTFTAVIIDAVEGDGETTAFLYDKSKFDFCCSGSIGLSGKDWRSRSPGFIHLKCKAGTLSKDELMVVAWHAPSENNVGERQQAYELLNLCLSDPGKLKTCLTDTNVVLLADMNIRIQPARCEAQIINAAYTGWLPEIKIHMKQCTSLKMTGTGGAQWNHPFDKVILLNRNKIKLKISNPEKMADSRSAEEIRVFSDHSWVKARISIEPVFNF